MNVGLGELADAVESILQLLLIMFKVCVAGILRNGNEFAKAHEDAGKRFRNEQAIPSVEDPRSFDRHVERAQWDAGGSREGDRAGLDFVARPTGSIEGEGNRPAILEGATKAEKSAHRVSAAGAFDGDESELANDASHVFAVIAIAAHYAYADITTDIRRRNDGSVPGRDDPGPLGDGLLRAFLAGNTYAEGGTDQADEPVSEKNNDAQDDALAKGEAAWIRSDFRCGRDFTGGGFGHEGIVIGPSRRATCRALSAQILLLNGAADLREHVAGVRADQAHGAYDDD